MIAPVAVGEDVYISIFCFSSDVIVCAAADKHPVSHHNRRENLKKRRGYTPYGVRRKGGKCGGWVELYESNTYLFKRNMRIFVFYYVEFAHIFISDASIFGAFQSAYWPYSRLACLTMVISFRIFSCRFVCF